MKVFYKFSTTAFTAMILFATVDAAVFDDLIQNQIVQRGTAEGISGVGESFAPIIEDISDRSYCL